MLPETVSVDTRPVTPVPHAERSAYERWHARLGVDAALETPWHRQLRERLEHFPPAGTRVLEIGSGRGGFACWLTSQLPSARVIAADFSSVALGMGRRHAARLGLTALDWAVADIQSIPFGTGAFDAVFSCETIEHVLRPRRAVEEIHRVLRPGGRLYLTCPNYLGPMGLYRGYLRLMGRPFTEEGQPINRFLLLPSTIRWLRSAGFQLEWFGSVGHYLPWPGARPRDLGVLGPAWLTRWFGLHSCVVGRKPLA